MTPVRLALIGCGRFGEVLGRILDSLHQARVVAVCDPNTAAARQLGAELGANWFSSAEELLADDSADAVVVSTPHHTHKSLTILAAEAGKHIFCEKPMALTANDCYDMIEAARRNGVKLMVGHKRRLRPQYAKVAALARAGEMGRPVAINISGWHGEEWWGRWWTCKESCGGTLHAGGAHDIDYMRFILGEVDWVYAVQGPTPGTSTDYADIIAVVLRFGSGAIRPLWTGNIVEYVYPTYGIDLTPQLMEQCCDTAVRLLDEVGFAVPNERFLKRVQGKPGLRIDGGRVHFDPTLTREYLDRFIASQASKRQPATEPVPATEWRVQINGYSMNVLDIETEEIRLATCRDLQDLIKLANSFGIGGYYPCMPQYLPPLMRAIACFKICWEMSENIQPYDYQHPAQIPYVYEMHQGMGRRFEIGLVVPSGLCVDPASLDIVLDFYADWKNNRDINFTVLDYGMIGIIKPVTVIGCATMTLAETLGLHILLNLFDPEIDLSVSLYGGSPTDLRNACWAFGSPRGHLFRYLNSRTGAHLFSYEPQVYRSGRVLLETSSSAVDEQAIMEKMACGLLGAM